MDPQTRKSSSTAPLCLATFSERCVYVRCCVFGIALLSYHAWRGELSFRRTANVSRAAGGMESFREGSLSSDEVGFLVEVVVLEAREIDALRSRAALERRADCMRV